LAVNRRRRGNQEDEDHDWKTLVRATIAVGVLPCLLLPALAVGQPTSYRQNPPVVARDPLHVATCPSVCAGQGGWSGAWNTTRTDAMSVCNCRDCS